eukprot:scaffold2724_cov260-Pinguiococcus_pyrenoidosus.AAC.17
MFGISWSDALSKGLVYNAADACQKLGLSGAQLDEKWSQLKRGKDMIKFGGGFYCGKVRFFVEEFRAASSRPESRFAGRRHLRDERLLHVHAGDVHDPAGADLLHDCRMAEREPELGRLPVRRLRGPGGKAWPASHIDMLCSGKVLGATNPMEAAVGSVRRLIMETWEFLAAPALAAALAAARAAALAPTSKLGSYSTPALLTASRRPQRPARHGKQWRARFGQPLRRSCGADELALRRPVERHVWTRSARRWHLGGDHLQLGGGSAGQLPGRRKGQPFRRAGGPQRRRGHSEGEEHQRRERRVEHSEAKGCGGKRINAD